MRHISINNIIILIGLMLLPILGWGQQTGNLDNSFNPNEIGANGEVISTTLQPDGKIIIGGRFTSYNRINRNRIARLNADGSLDNTFNPATGADDIIRSTTLQPDGKIIIGGQFTSYNGNTRIGITRLNADGSLDNSFNPSGAGAGGSYPYVYSTILQPDGKIIIGGNFWSYNGIARNYIARLNSDGSLDNTFNLAGTGLSDYVSSIILQPDGKILIGGEFAVPNGSSRVCIARLNTDGSLDPTFVGSLDARVSKFAIQQDGKIIIVGYFLVHRNVNNIATEVNYIARLNTDGSLDNTFNLNRTFPSDAVHTSTLQADGKIIIGGHFTSFYDRSTRTRNDIIRIARLNTDGSLDDSFNPSGAGTNGVIWTTTIQPDGKIIIGGDFNTYNETTINHISRIFGTSCTTPETPIISGATSIPVGRITTLTSSSATGNLWNTGETTQSITVSTMGRYSVRVISGTCTSDASNVIVVDLNVSNYTVSTLAGSGNPTFANGIGIGASFSFPSGVAVDRTGNVYVADHYNHRIRKVTPNGTVTTLAGSGNPGYSDALGVLAVFNHPTALCLDSENNIYVADQGNHRIRKINPNGLVSTVAGTGSPSFTDGTGTSASFRNPTGVTIDIEGNLYVADRDNHRIRKISTTGTVSTYAGSGTQSFAEGIGTNAHFNFPLSVAVDFIGNVYVADKDNHRIRKISPTRIVTTLAGSGSQNFSDGLGNLSTFSFPTGVSVDAVGNIYVADQYNQRIRKITPTGNVITIAGNGNYDYVEGSGQLASFKFPSGVAVDNEGNVFVAEWEGHRIRKITPNSCLIPSTPTISGTTSFCFGSSTLLTSSAATGNLWSNGATTQSVTVTEAGNYSVRVISGACTSEVSNSTLVSTIICNQIFTGDGLFSNAGRWSGNSIPVTGTDITVRGNMALSSSVSLRNIIIESEGTISIPSGVVLTVTGNLSNQGIISGEGAVKLSGSNNQNFGGGTISNLVVENGATVIQNSATQIVGSLSLGNNQALNLNGNALTLLSTATQTARLTQVPASSSITNASNFTVQRWLDRGFVRRIGTNNGNYLLLGSVVNGQTVGLWNGVSPYSPATFNQSTPSGGSFYFYNTAVNNWIKPTSLGQSLPVGVGAQVWFGINNFFAGNRNHWSATGTPVIGNFNLPLTNGVTGFNLVSNPYPSTIDWDSPNWTKTGVANAIYIFDWVNFRYKTYVNGIQTNGASRYLPTAQGFFVNTTTISPVLTAIENIKVSNQVALQRTESQVSGLIRLQLTNGTVNDEMVIANRPTANTAFEPDQDAQKMMNPTTNVFVSGPVNQSIASMNLDGVNSIPFIIKSSNTGTVTLNTTELSGLEGYTFNLYNEQTGELLPYTGTETYSFNVSANQPYRLQLRVGSVTGIETFKAKVFEVFPNPASDKVTIITNGNGKIEIVNNLGQLLITQPAIGNNEINISKLAMGVYIVKFNGVSQKLVVR